MQPKAQDAQGVQAQLQPTLALKYSTAAEQQRLLQQVLNSAADRNGGGRNGAEPGVGGGNSSQPPGKTRRQGSAADAEKQARVRRVRRDLVGSKR